MPGTPVKSRRPDPRAIDLNEFIKEVYEIRWEQGKIIVKIDVKMAEREFGVRWTQSQSFAGMTPDDIPPQCIISIVDWDTWAVIYLRPKEWDTFRKPKPVKDDQRDESSALVPASIYAYLPKEEEIQDTFAEYAPDDEEAQADAEEESEEPKLPDALVLKHITCDICKWENQNGFAHCDQCGYQLKNSSLGSEAVTRATNALVNQANKVLGLTLVPVRRTVSKEGLARKKAKEMCKTAKRRKFKDLLDEWDSDITWQNSMISSGWTREDMVFAMSLAATEGLDPNNHRMSWRERQARSSVTKVVRFVRDDGSTFTPPPDKSPYYQNAVDAGRDIGADEGFEVISRGQTGGNLLKTAYTHGRAYAWEAQQERDSRADHFDSKRSEASQSSLWPLKWEPSSSSKSSGKRWEDQKLWEDVRPWKKQQWHEKF
jgi:hypothetical protein